MPPCNGDCNQGRECNCGCKMTKDEALRMALRWITDVSTNNEDEVIQACKEALAQPSNMVTIPLDKLEDMQRRLKEPTVVELNDEYLRDTHVEGMPKDGDCCTEGCIKCDAIKVFAETQEPKPPTILARLPNEATVSNVYEAYEARLKEGKAETQEPVGYVDEIIKTQHWLCLDGQMVVAQLYTAPPSREWQRLSDEEIEEAVNYLNVKIDYPIMFARLIEMHLKEKNG